MCYVVLLVKRVFESFSSSFAHVLVWELVGYSFINTVAINILRIFNSAFVFSNIINTRGSSKYYFRLFSFEIRTIH